MDRSLRLPRLSRQNLRKLRQWTKSHARNNWQRMNEWMSEGMNELRRWSRGHEVIRLEFPSLLVPVVRHARQNILSGHTLRCSDAPVAIWQKRDIWMNRRTDWLTDPLIVMSGRIKKRFVLNVIIQKDGSLSPSLSWMETWEQEKRGPLGQLRMRQLRFDESKTNWRTHGQTDGRMYRPSHRDAWEHPKTPHFLSIALYYAIRMQE